MYIVAISGYMLQVGYLCYLVVDTYGIVLEYVRMQPPSSFLCISGAPQGPQLDCQGLFFIFINDPVQASTAHFLLSSQLTFIEDVKIFPSVSLHNNFSLSYLTFYMLLLQVPLFATLIVLMLGRQVGYLFKLAAFVMDPSVFSYFYRCQVLQNFNCVLWLPQLLHTCFSYCYRVVIYFIFVATSSLLCRPYLQFVFCY